MPRDCRWSLLQSHDAERRNERVTEATTLSQLSAQRQKLGRGRGGTPSRLTRESARCSKIVGLDYAHPHPASRTGGQPYFPLSIDTYIAHTRTHTLPATDHPSAISTASRLGLGGPARPTTLGGHGCDVNLLAAIADRGWALVSGIFTCHDSRLATRRILQTPTIGLKKSMGSRPRWPTSRLLVEVLLQMHFQGTDDQPRGDRDNRVDRDHQPFASPRSTSLADSDFSFQWTLKPWSRETVLSLVFSSLPN